MMFVEQQKVSFSVPRRWCRDHHHFLRTHLGLSLLLFSSSAFRCWNTTKLLFCIARLIVRVPFSLLFFLKETEKTNTWTQKNKQIKRNTSSLLLMMMMMMHASSSTSSRASSLFVSSTRTTALRNSARRPPKYHHHHSKKKKKNTNTNTNKKASSTTPPIIRCHQNCFYETVELGKTQNGIAFTDLNNICNEMISKRGIKNGQIIVHSRHTTTAVTINEYEERLVDDARQFLLKLVPPLYPYLHNDLHVRFPPDDDRWKGTVEEWRAQEPLNAHSHLIAMLLGQSVTVPICDGKMTLGTWQSILFVELDGERERTVGIQVSGE